MASQISVEIRPIAPTTSEAAVRQHKILIDRPADKGGADQGPMGGELFLVSIGGCFMSNLLVAIKAREVKVTDLKVEVTGRLAESPARFSAVEINVTADCSGADPLEKLVEIAERGCIITNTLRGKLVLTVKIGAAV